MLSVLCADLRNTLLPSYGDLLSNVFHLLKHPLSPDSLTAWLSAFSSLLKHILVPSGDTSLFGSSWSILKGFFLVQCVHCPHEVQRAVAEAWGTVLRRSKADLRLHTLALMLRSIAGNEGLDDFIAWAVLSVCSVSSIFYSLPAWDPQAIL